MRYVTQYAMVAGLAVLVSGCGMFSNDDKTPQPVIPEATPATQNIPPSQRQAYNEKRSTLGSLFSAPTEQEAALERNPDLWAATLDVLGGFALRSTDAAGGVVITDWNPQGKDQFQITVRIEGNRILPRFVVVNVLKKNAQGVVQPADANVAQALQNRILERAKSLRAQREGTS